ncbi:MAG: cytochrome P450 [Comamonas sp.]|jgi:cytochrome P450|uniref:cytochrome P450 n=1 Tax=Comamonas sp. TaxID=34028 RepID=UPI00281C796D|nr:cytochrome P450 [Comamonas sp.]MDR0215265.1 cytochrome P450 [Comamonas sp.]
MSRFCPAYPKPHPEKASKLSMFWHARRSWMDALFERSYTMQMGEVHLPGVDLYMLNDIKEVKRVMQTEAQAFPKSHLLHESLEPLLGESIFTTNGEQWQRQRTMMNPAFAQARVNVAFPRMLGAAQAMLERLDAVDEARPYDIEVEMTHVTADIIFRTIFSTPMQGPDAHRIFDAFARYQALAPKLMLPALFGARWLRMPWYRWQSNKAAKEIRGLLHAMIRPRYKSHLKGEATEQEDILAAFMQAKDPKTDQPFTEGELVNQVAMLFLAGHETSASALTWASYLLAMSPDVQQKAYEQVMEVIGDRTPEQSDMKDCSRVWNIFRETLRLFPPVGFFARENVQACPVRGKQLKERSTVVVAPWLLQRHRKWWKDPDAFDPDRFEREEDKDAIKHAYMPFSMGPRVCLGAAFALQEAVLILTCLLRRYEILPAEGHVPQPVGRLTIRSENGVRIRLRKRAAA